MARNQYWTWPEFLTNEENGDMEMYVGYTNFNLQTKGGWEAAMTTVEMVHICPVHGRTYGTSDEPLCYEDAKPRCNEATYGPPCIHCDYINYDIPRDTDNAHNELCMLDRAGQ